MQDLSAAKKIQFSIIFTCLPFITHFLKASVCLLLKNDLKISIFVKSVFINN